MTSSSAVGPYQDRALAYIAERSGHERVAESTQTARTTLDLFVLSLGTGIAFLLVWFVALVWWRMKQTRHIFFPNKLH